MLVEISVPRIMGADSQGEREGRRERPEEVASASAPEPERPLP